VSSSEMSQEVDDLSYDSGARSRIPSLDMAFSGTAWLSISVAIAFIVAVSALVLSLTHHTDNPGEDYLVQRGSGIMFDTDQSLAANDYVIMNVKASDVSKGLYTIYEQQNLAAGNVTWNSTDGTFTVEKTGTYKLDMSLTITLGSKQMNLSLGLYKNEDASEVSANTFYPETDSDIGSIAVHGIVQLAKGTKYQTRLYVDQRGPYVPFTTSNQDFSYSMSLNRIN
jgi:hypothetical protein